MVISLLRNSGLKTISSCSIQRNVYVLFFLKTYPRDLSFSTSDVQVPIVDHLELLGVTIDNSLNFIEHIGKIINKVGNQLDVLSRLKNTLSIS